MLSFLVLVEGYVLVGGEIPAVPATVPVALGVGAVGSILAHGLARRLHGRSVLPPRDRDDRGG